MTSEGYPGWTHAITIPFLGVEGYEIIQVLMKLDHTQKTDLLRVANIDEDFLSTGIFGLDAESCKESYSDYRSTCPQQKVIIPGLVMAPNRYIYCNQ